MEPHEIQPESLLAFWFGASASDPAELGARVPRWFSSTPEQDAEIRARFGSLPDRALRGELDGWQQDPRHAVALLIVLDQLPRNLRRGEPGAFACDARALEVCLAWLDAGGDRELSPVFSVFGYLPLEHAEDRGLQARCVELFRGLLARVEGDWRPHFEGFLSYAERHREVVDRFGRFPHRNRVLGRESTDEELAWLEAGGDTFGG